MFVAQYQSQAVQDLGAWAADFTRVNSNALTCEWFASPLEYFWPNGKKLFDGFSRTRVPLARRLMR